MTYILNKSLLKQKGRIHWLASWFTPFIALGAYLAFWPTGVDPQAWKPPRDAGYVGVHAPNTRLAGVQQIQLQPGQAGPEHITAYQGVLYTGLSNGDVIRLNADGSNQTKVLSTNGRPLGIDFDRQGRMLIADAYKGLIRVTFSPKGETKASIIAAKVDEPVPNDPIRYADAVKVAPDGTIWLTDASRRFSAQELDSTFEASVLDILEHSCTGRLIAIDPNTLRTRVALSGLCFPNGLAFHPDGKTLYLSETGTFRILRVNLPKLSVAFSSQGAIGAPTLDQALKQGAAQVMVANLPGYPDNLMRSPSGRLWVGLTKPRSPLVDELASRPFLRGVVLRLPRALWPVPKAYGHVMAYNDAGQLVADLQDPSGAYPETTSVTELDGKLFIQSLHAHSIGWVPESVLASDAKPAAVAP